MKKLLLTLLACVLILSLFACGSEEPPVETDAPEPPAPTATEGLIYAESADGGCSVIGYKGTDRDILVPAEYGGLKVTSIGDCAFMGNKSITTLTLGENVKEIGAAAFTGCERLMAVSLGTSLQKIGSAAFFGCSELSSVDIPATVKHIGLDAFAACDAVSALNYDGNQSMWTHVDVAPNNDVFNTKLVLVEGGSLVKLIADGDCNANISWRLGYDGILIISGNGHIPDYAFDKLPWGAYVESITSIVVEDGIDVIGKNAFLGCNKAVTVDIAPSVRLIDDSAFYGCSALAEITLPERLRRIGESAFFGCSSLKTLVIPDTVTAIGSGAFMGCSALESVTLSSAVTVMEKWSFANCVSLRSIDLSGVTAIGTGAFFRCSALTSAAVSGGLTEIGTNAFLSCPRISVTGVIPATAVVGDGNTSIRP